MNLSAFYRKSFRIFSKIACCTEQLMKCNNLVSLSVFQVIVLHKLGIGMGIENHIPNIWDWKWECKIVFPKQVGKELACLEVEHLRNSDSLVQS